MIRTQATIIKSLRIKLNGKKKKRETIIIKITVHTMVSIEGKISSI
jgi:hypothetical protein